MPGTYPAEMQSDPGMAALYLLVLLPQAVIYTALWWATKGSTLSAIGYHWLTNLAGEGLHLTATAEPYRAAAITLIASSAGWWLHKRQPNPQLKGKSFRL